MKKYFALFLLVLLYAFSTMGCTNTTGKNDEVEKTTENKRERKNGKVQRQRGENVAKGNNKEKRQRGEQEIHNIEYRYVDVGDSIRGRLHNEENFHYDISIKKAQLLSDEYQEINASMDEYLEVLAKKSVEKMEKLYELVGAGYEVKSKIIVEPIVVRADNSIFSIEYRFSHIVNVVGYSVEFNDSLAEGEINRAFNFDIATQKEITFDDFVTDRSGFVEIAKSIITDFGYENANPKITQGDIDTLMSKDNPYFLIGYDTLDIRNTGELSDVFSWTLSIPLREYPQLFAMDYLKVPKSYVTYIPTSGMGYVDLNNDGKDDLFRMDLLKNETEEDIDSIRCKLVTREQEYILSKTSHQFIKPMIVRLESGKKFLYTLRYNTVSPEIYFVGLDVGGGELTDQYLMDGVFLEGEVNPSRVTNNNLSYIMGVLYANRDGNITEDGRFVPSANLSYFDKRTSTLTLKKAINATRVDEQLNDVEPNVQLQMGIRLLPLYTNDENFVILKGEDGSLFKIDIINGTWNGEILDDVFDGLINSMG